MLSAERARSPIRRFLRWMTPGMHLKRWLLIAVAGGVLFLDGFDRILNWYGYNFHINQTIDRVTAAWLWPQSLAWLLIIIGAVLVYYGLRQWMRSIVHAVSPDDGQRLIEVIYERRQLNRGQRIVAVGGGTGLSTLLRGLKEYTSNVTAVVTVTDDGGSSGRLRQELGLLPPGDIRNCLVALADSESMMTDLFQYRFNEGDGLSGHSFGNLFIAAMCGIAGDFDRAIKESSRVLAIRGRVLPSTLADIVLQATLADGTTVTGESSISKSSSPIRQMRLVPENCQPLPEVIEAIGEADLIVLGPGSLYTSIVPNLLVPGIAEAISGSRALKVYICNIMTQPGETDGMTASDHVRVLLSCCRDLLFDYVLINVQEPHLLREVYESEGAHYVSPDLEAVRGLGVAPISSEFLAERQLLRHDPSKLTQTLIRLMLDRTDSSGSIRPPARRAAPPSPIQHRLKI